LDATPGWGLTHDTFDDEQPSPAFETVGIIELKDGESEETTEGITDLRSRVQNSGSESHSLFLVKDREKEDCLCMSVLISGDLQGLTYTWEEGSFGES
jgi:hypothetical protein